LSLAIAGCAGQPIVSNAYYDTGYAPYEYLGQGPLPVVVRGNPYAVPQTDLDSAVADAMQGTTFGTTTRFAAADPGPQPAYRVVMLFNPSTTTYGAALCRRPEPPNAVFGEGPAARVAVSAALCRGDSAMVYADGSIGTNGGPQGSEFRGGVQRISMTLFTPKDHQKGNDGMNGANKNGNH
jgi:hypothetical protein